MRSADDTVASLFKRSDEALYLSKRTGRNRVSTQYVAASIDLATDIRGC
jgi:PleD family two-component response regulator